MELRINIKLRLKLSKTATVTKEILKQVYGEEELSRSRILNGLAFFGMAKIVSKMTCTMNVRVP